MARESDQIRVTRYERDLATAQSEIAQLKHLNRTTRYERTLTQLEGEGFEIDRATEMEGLTQDAPEGYEASREKQIRNFYRRSIVGQAPLRTGEIDSPGKVAELTPADKEKCYNHAMQKGCTFSQAKTALGFK